MARNINSRTTGSGCPKCAKYGYHQTSPGWLYLMKHPHWGLLQIGITNVPQIRRRQHERIGWRLIDMLGPMDGSVARNTEQSLLLLLPSLGAVMTAEQIAGKFSGFTECWVADSFPVTSLNELIDRLSP